MFYPVTENLSKCDIVLSKEILLKNVPTDWKCHAMEKVKNYYYHEYTNQHLSCNLEALSKGKHKILNIIRI